MHDARIPLVDFCIDILAAEQERLQREYAQAMERAESTSDAFEAASARLLVKRLLAELQKCHAQLEAAFRQLEGLQ